MGSAIKFKQTGVPRQTGEKARIKVVQGPDFGSTYVIVGTRATLGRGEENDIILTDLKSSRLHAQVAQDANGKWRVKDLGSANGILFNNKPTKESEIKLNDIVTIGETVLEFISAEMGSGILIAPARTSESIQTEQSAFRMARDRVSQSFGLFSAGGSTIAKGGAASSKKPLIYIGGGLLLALLFMVNPQEKNSKSQSKSAGSSGVQDLASFLPTPDFNKTSDMLFKDGLREYFAHNYGRARTQFETVLQITPGHILATLYLENCNKAVEDEVKLNLEGGKKSFDAGKFREAKGHFETVMRLLFRDQANSAYLEARDQFDKVVKASKGEALKL